MPTGMCLECCGTKALGKTCVWGGGSSKVARRGVVRGSSAGRVCWKGARKVKEGVPALEGSAARARWKGVPALEGGFQQSSSHGLHRIKGFKQGFHQRFKQALYHLHTSYFGPLWMSGRNWCSETSHWPRRRQEERVQHV